MFDASRLSLYYLSECEITAAEIQAAYDALSDEDKAIIDGLYDELVAVSALASQPYLVKFSEATISDRVNAYIEQENNIVAAILKGLGIKTCSSGQTSTVYYVG